MRLWKKAPKGFRLYNAAASRCAEAAALAVIVSAILKEDIYPTALVLACAVCIRMINAGAVRALARRGTPATCRVRS